MQRGHTTPGTIADLLSFRATEERDRVAYRFLTDGEGEARTLTYGALDRRARQLAACLLDRGARPGDRALLLHAPGLDYIEALFACAYAGVVAVPAYPPRLNRPMLRLRALVDDAGARFAFTSAPILARLEPRLEGEPSLRPLAWITPDQAAAQDPAGLLVVAAAPEALAVLQYTSGSTGAPKGVMLSHRNLLANAAAIAEQAGLTRDDRFVGWLPPFHDMGLIGSILTPAAVGFESTLFPPTAFLQQPLRWLRAITRHGGTLTAGPNFAYDLCARRATPEQVAALDLGRLRLAFCGAERVSPATVEAFSAAFAPAGFRRSAFCPSYGLAEATLAVALRPADAAPLVVAFDAAALAAGRLEAPGEGALARTLVGNGPPAGCEVAVVDPETLRRRGAGATGEIWVRGPGVAGGYWGKAELSDRIFRARLADGPEGEAGWLRTGDLGFLRDGQVFVAGRLKDLIILLGVNHHPEDLEATVAPCHPRLRQGGAAAFSVDTAGEEQLVLVLEVDTARDLPSEAIAEAVRSAVADEHELAVHEVVLVRAGQIPRTSSGKVQRRACRDLHLEGRLEALATSRLDAGAPAGGAPDEELVAQVRALMASVLSLDEVRPDDDFFALGGHSLLATQLASRIHQALQVELPVRDVFEAPTAASLARRIAAAGASAPMPGLVRLDRSGPLQLSYAQERMWFLHQLDPGGSAYNVAGAVEVEGDLDTAALGRALQGLVDRHEILRTNYPTVNGAPRVTIAASLQVPLPILDLAGTPDPSQAAERQAEAVASAPFDLAVDPLIRGCLCRLGPGRHVVAVCLHHIVADGWSMGVLVAELFRAYQAERHGRSAEPPPAELQYLDYAGWQRAHLAAAGERGLEFWRARLTGAPMLQLPTDHPRSRPSSRGAIEPLGLPAELLGRLRDLANQHGATLFMVTLAAFEAVLHRYTGQRSIVVGVPVANRNRLSAEPLIGTLVNTLPLRVEVDPDATFLDLLRSVRDASLDAFDHQEFPLERLVSELQVERVAGQTPLFPVMFDFLNVPMPVGDAGGLRLRPLTFSRRASQFDLSLIFLDTELGRVGALEYRTDLYEAATIRRLAGHYRAVLEAAVADPHARLSEIRLLTAAERAGQLARAEAACAGPRSLEAVHRQFEAQAARTPGAPAVADAAGTLTYRELDRAAEALALRLAALGAGPGQRVAICLERSRAVAVALLATLRTGAAYLPLDPRYPADRIRYVLEDAGPTVLVADEAALERLAVPPGVAVITLDARDLAQAEPPAARPPADPSAAAYVIYTSGSTGRPKGVEIPHAALSNFIASMRREPGLTAADRLLSVTTISFDIAGLEIFLPLCTGACVEIVESEIVEDGRRLAERLARSGATVMQATPATWRMLVDSGWRGDGRLKLLVGGEALPRELADQLLARVGEVWNMYGPTETTIWSSVHRVTAGDGPIPIGRPVDQTRLYVLDPRGDLVPDGLPGEIFIGGAGVARGYHERPELNAERFLEDPFGGPGARMYRTGDAGRFRHDGALEYLGRLDHQVKIRGHRIEPGEIEAVLREHAQIRDAVVVAREDRPGDVRLAAYLVARGAEALPLPELRELLRRRLPSFMVPSYLMALEALPLTPNGKIDRKALPAPAAGAAAEPERPVPPRDPLEAAILEVWEEILGVRVASVTASFFDLGGHSLLVARLLDRVEKRTGAALPFATLLDGPTVAHLAEAVRERQRQDPDAPVSPQRALVEIRPGGDRAPLFCVHGAGGNVLNLYDLGRHLDPARPLVGLQAPGTDGTTAPPATIEAMAAAYLGEVQARQPRGPYHLSGYCGGGLVAFEMAHQLRASGEAVASLTLIDFPCPALPAGPGFLRRWGDILLRAPREEIARRGRTRLSTLTGALACSLRVGLALWRRVPVPYELREFWLIRAFQRASGAYRLRPWPGQLLVLRARDGAPLPQPADERLGWGPYASTVKAEEVPGDHYSITREPNVQVLVEHLEASLARAETAGRVA